MLILRVEFLALILLLLAGTFARAEVDFEANLTHSQEVSQGTFTTSTGAPRPMSFGTATLILSDAETQLSMTSTITNIDVTGTQTPDTYDNLMSAHIHVGAAAGINAPVRWGFFGSPDNDNNPNNLVVTPFSSGVGGTFSSVWDLLEGNSGTTLASNLPNILAGLSYLNFHTVQFPAGEIRGQIIPVPEPSSMALLSACAISLAGCVWRRRRVLPAV